MQRSAQDRSPGVSGVAVAGLDADVHDEVRIWVVAGGYRKAARIGRIDHAERHEVRDIAGDVGTNEPSLIHEYGAKGALGCSPDP